jgi:hypothetical protein
MATINQRGTAQYANTKRIQPKIIAAVSFRLGSEECMFD